MLPEPTERLRFRPMVADDVDAITALLIAFDPMRGDPALVFGMRLGSG